MEKYTHTHTYTYVRVDIYTGIRIFHNCRIYFFNLYQKHALNISLYVTFFRMIQISPFYTFFHPLL